MRDVIWLFAPLMRSGLLPALVPAAPGAIRPGLTPPLRGERTFTVSTWCVGPETRLVRSTTFWPTRPLSELRQAEGLNLVGDADLAGAVEWREARLNVDGRPKHVLAATWDDRWAVVGRLGRLSIVVQASEDPTCINFVMTRRLSGFQSVEAHLRAPNA